MVLIRESKGLLVFIVIYVLVRGLLALPIMAIQEKTTIAIAIAAFAISWAIFTSVMDERKAMFLALGLLATAIFSYLSFEVFALQEVKYATWAVMACTAFIALLNSYSIIRKDKQAGLLLALGTAVLLIVLIGIELLIPVLY